MQYQSRKGWQPICIGIDYLGELIWDLRIKEIWHQKMFPARYDGDFSDQWMWLVLQEKGIDWCES